MTGTRTTAGIVVTLEFKLERETKGAVRYEEVLAGPLVEGTIGTLYVRKAALARMGFTEIPRKITVNMEVG